MDIDLRMMAQCAQEGIGIIRLYTWNPPALSVGVYQKTDRIDLLFMNDQGIDFVHRPTGGKAVLHDRELTYAVAVPVIPERKTLSVVESYRMITQGLISGLALLGIVPTPARIHPPQTVSAACFDHVSLGEPLFRGGKLIGSAQYRTARSILQHGSLPFELDLRKYVRCFQLSMKERDILITRLKKSVRTLADWKIRWEDRSDVVHALQLGFAKVSDQLFESGGTG